jgi:histidine triad (HIT) family protein
MKPDCLFCKLANDNQTPVWQNAEFAAIKDIHPKASVHLLIIPKVHVDSLQQVSPEMAPGLTAAIQDVATKQGVADGYRVQFNIGRKGGQEIDHLHAHLLAG